MDEGDPVSFDSCADPCGLRAGERRRADSSSYARDILLKYRLTREQLGERFGEV